MKLLHQIGHYFYKYNVPFLPKLVEILIFVLFNSRIPSDVQIGKGSYFSYQGLSTLLVKGTRIGENCSIGMRVTTARNFPYKDVPVIKNNVFIGANSVLLGPIIVEDNVIISPNSLVNKSIPEGAIVGGIPAEIIGWVDNLEYNIHENPKYKKGKKSFLQD